MKSIKCGQVCIHVAAFALFVLSFTGCAGNGVYMKAYSPETTAHYSRLRSYPEPGNLKDCVFYVNEGETIPVKLSMETDFMAFKEEQIEIVAKQKLYFLVRMAENLSSDELSRLNKLDARSFSKMSKEEKADFLRNYTLYISRDARRWAPLSGSRAYKEVLGFKTGQLSFTILATAPDGLGASLDIRTVE